MSIRENVEKQLTAKLSRKLAIESHVSHLSNRLYVYPDGSLFNSEEVSDNTWQEINGKPVQTLYKFYHSCGCNCDFCSEYERYKEIISHNDDFNKNEIKNAEEQLSFNEETGNYDSKAEWLARFIDDTEEVSDVFDRMLENLESIPIGYFDDEKE